MTKRKPPANRAVALVTRPDPTAKGGTGAKVTVTPAGVELCRELAAGGHPLYGIRAVLGLGRDAFDAARDRQPELVDALDAGHAELEVELVHCLLEAARKGQYACAMFLLKTRCNYRETGPVDGGPDSRVQVIIQIPEPMSKAEFARIIEGSASLPDQPALLGPRSVER